LASRIDAADSHVQSGAEARASIAKQTDELAVRVDGLKDACESSVSKVGEDLESVRSALSAVSTLEVKVDEGLGSVREELSKHSTLHESTSSGISSLDARLVESSASLEARLNELSEQQAASTQAAVDKVDARLTAVSQEHTDATSTISTEMASLSASVSEHGGRLETLASRIDAADSHVQSGAEARASIAKQTDELAVRVDGLKDACESTVESATGELTRVIKTVDARLTAVSVKIRDVSGRCDTFQQTASDELDSRLTLTVSELENKIDSCLETLRTELSKVGSLQKAALSVANGRISDMDERVESISAAQAAASEASATELASVQQQQDEKLTESMQQLNAAVEAVGARPIVVEEISEKMEDWLDGRLEVASSSQMEIVQQLEETTGELDSAISMLQRKISANEQLSQSTQEELVALTESAETRHTMLMTRIIKSTTGGVTKSAFEQQTLKLNETCAKLDEVGESLAHLKDTVAAEAQLKESTAKLEGLVESSQQKVSARAAEIAEDLHLLHGEFAKLKVEVLMLKAGGAGAGGGGGLGAGQHQEQYDEAAMVRESLRVTRDGKLPDALQTVAVRVSQTRERNLHGKTEIEYAIELYIEAPGEDLLVVKVWRPFRAFWDLIRTIGSQVHPSPTLPQKEDTPDLQVKLVAFVSLVLRNTPASHRHPLEGFLGLST
jgi:hypothetical protein